ncbi:acyltransferase [Erysipelothrix sp. strain 2 (EsS2-7-Brazil)]|uniref:acyltransferase family protein n=1 Tax=Erysipelothrix sp. strain 2 (EsS2-7-Brazil) TaxID=2500579 RepID=UPI00190C29EE|nr:acyltransferase family protein [Erysipelothrix sp. strain 2 (EsS2-7-Brazil)]MBK2404673.1 acyltransferase [Erysipelothrix sp. strain 2 (EsS2-7-Brazil)]
MTTLKQRYLWIDNFKGILILMVVFGHGLEFLRHDLKSLQFIYNLIYMVHMPAFVFISGYLSKNIEKGRNDAFRTFFIPFFIFNTLWAILKLLPLGIQTTDGIPIFSFLTPGWAMWFLLAMFIWKLLLPSLLHIKDIFALSLFIGVLGGLFTEFGDYLTLSRILVFLPYFLAGYFTTHQTIADIQSQTKHYPVLIFAIVILAAYLYTFVLNLPSEFLWGDRSYHELFTTMGYPILLAIIRYGLGFMGIYVLLNRVPDHQTRLNRFGKNSLNIYMFHTYLLILMAPITFNLENRAIRLILVLSWCGVIVYMLSSKPMVSAYDRFIGYIYRRLFRNQT